MQASNKVVSLTLYLIYAVENMRMAIDYEGEVKLSLSLSRCH